MILPTNYQLKTFRNYALAGVCAVFVVLVIANIYTYFFTKKIYINKKAYYLKDGFPIFISEEEYINFVSSYPYDPGVELQIYKVKGGETLWSIKQCYGISIDTLLAANPYLESLELKPGQRIVIPAKNGVLFPFDDYYDVNNMKKLLGSKEKAKGNYKPKIYKIFSPDDMRLAFFENCRPVIVNKNIERIYKYKMAFADPVDTGFFTSMFGDRVDPIYGEGLEFHNGVDIATHAGTPIKAVRDGMVFFSGWKDGFGYTIIVQHDDGYTTFYAHCSRMFVKEGQWVKQGEVIGAVGSTGRSTGNHLHYTIYRHGKTLNPIKYLW
ncbi:MAG: Murein DD-endopeptidase MepM [Spirochaetes bacterium ADurb.Bin218]|jgi:murein DD-endopeptidase MepM/ murein hydrolase activator NlpD|nr:MAG: Murein DD-endopeptidase MepM [Spirochaetes bacterium ADurb.Bin218]HOV08467.1 M23 family metallopeptidase [Spirochaetota bacterium]